MFPAARLFSQNDAQRLSINSYDGAKRVFVLASDFEALCVNGLEQLVADQHAPLD
jgi:hypothetical protein